MLQQDMFAISGPSPLVRIQRLGAHLRPSVFAGLEYVNPSGTQYWNQAVSIIRQAEAQGEISPGMTIVDWTYGASGIALAMAAVPRGYKVLLVIPDRISREKQQLCKAIGAEVVITPSCALPGEPRSCVNVAENLVANLHQAYFANMYEHPLSRSVHEEVTAPRLWEQTGGNFTHLFVPVTSGALVSGLGRWLKQKNPAIRIVGVEPEGSVYRDLFKGEQTTCTVPCELEEIGALWASSLWDPAVIDEIVQVSDYDALNCSRDLLQAESIFAGGSSGAAMYAALRAGAHLGSDASLVVMMGDSGSFYMSKVFNDQWMKEQGFYRKAPSSRGEITAEEILGLKSRKDLIFAHPENTLAEVFEMMKQNDVSQLPVVSYGTAIGSISENKILSILIENDEAMNSNVVGFMEQPFAVCQPHATISELSEKLQENTSGVLISLSDGRMQLLTKSDLIDALTHK
ncbi:MULTISPECIES: pyridoxal-phosphate dependent enzyme [Prosthecochloris]|uniref:Pyridoxal-phosphate dependent enzyme n=1 Tax=Prosthecochloris vibrioformis TaxID=1098 RepID=A0A5C4S310_PROVB|nr:MULTISPECIES: pyridoxal-phosphate dependent enzyme [Prosthecochloris]ANT65751.1 Putative cystathionine beta-synthase [Prosthecochloris sp. CIB 2401]TNJ37876.1 pyridoxal-phosphate dependent enzyme [Prosthecochloris vibrioformis]